MENTQNYFNELNAIDVGNKVERKNGLSYLSWAFAWGELKKKFPLSYYTVYEMERDGYKLNYFHDGKTAWVKTGVTVVFPDGRELEHTDYLPIMDNRNNSLPLDKVNSWEVNKTIQRSLTKAVARHGVGLYIYAGEDLPEEVKTSNAAGKPEKTSGAPTLKELIKKIAELFARLKANNGDTAIYNEIVTKVTGDASFRCNAATDADYDKVAAIYKELLAVVNK